MWRVMRRHKEAPQAPQALDGEITTCANTALHCMQQESVTSLCPRQLPLEALCCYLLILALQLPKSTAQKLLQTATERKSASTSALGAKQLGIAGKESRHQLLEHSSPQARAPQEFTRARIGAILTEWELPTTRLPTFSDCTLRHLIIF